MDTKEVRQGLGYLVTVPLVLVGCVAALILGMFVFGVAFNAARTFLVWVFEGITGSL